jgi:hypothetical protein
LPRLNAGRFGTSGEEGRPAAFSAVIPVYALGASEKSEEAGRRNVSSPAALVSVAPQGSLVNHVHEWEHADFITELQTCSFQSRRGVR